jgi:hypothetical protein
MRSLKVLGALCAVVGVSAMVSDIVNTFQGQPLNEPVGFGLLLVTVGAIAILSREAS